MAGRHAASGSDLLSVLTTDLRPISLSELNDNAALHRRNDRKYVVDGDVVGQLITDFSDDLQVLDDGERRSFAYRTLYFDTPDLDLYRLAATRRRHRHKVRLRHYVDTDESMLEVKVKSARGQTVKHRFDHEPGSFEFGDRARSLVRSVTPIPQLVDDLAPMMWTDFRRTTLFDGASSSRITIDSDLVCEAIAGGSVALDRLVIETKSVGVASSVDRWLWRNAIRPSRISKYATTMAILRPELPTNRWHRTIARHF